MQFNQKRLKSIVLDMKELDEQRKSIETVMSDAALIGLTSADVNSMESLCQVIKEKRTTLANIYLVVAKNSRVTVN